MDFACILFVVHPCSRNDTFSLFSGKESFPGTSHVMEESRPSKTSRRLPNIFCIAHHTLTALLATGDSVFPGILIYSVCCQPSALCTEQRWKQGKTFCDKNLTFFFISFPMCCISSFFPNWNFPPGRGLIRFSWNCFQGSRELRRLQNSQGRYPNLETQIKNCREEETLWWPVWEPDRELQGCSLWGLLWC